MPWQLASVAAVVPLGAGVTVSCAVLSGVMVPCQPGSCRAGVLETEAVRRSNCQQSETISASY